MYLRADAAINPEINYQGKLVDDAGALVANGSYSMQFRLYTVASGGSSIWNETQSVTVTDGLFSVLLGEVSGLAGVDFDQTLYLGVEVASDGEMTPRKRIGSVPTAFVAETANDAALLSGVASSSFLRSDAADALSASSTGTLLSITQSGAGDVLSLFTGATEFFTATNAGNIGIGTSTPSSKLSVAGDLYVTGSFRDSTNSAGTSGYVLLSTGTGTSWVATSSLGIGGGGGSSLFTDGGATTYLTATGDNLAVGTSTQIGSARLSVDGGVGIGLGQSYYIGSMPALTFYDSPFVSYTNVFVGTAASGIDEAGAYENTATGYNALASLTTGDYNTAYGARALQSATSSYSNTAFGHYALMQTTSGVSNVGVGDSSLMQNTTGSANTAIGHAALQNATDGNNSAVGHAALYGVTSGANNVGFGVSAGEQITTGSQNIAIGSYAGGGPSWMGFGITTGSRNIAIGYQSMVASATGSNQLSIGNLIYGTGLDGTATTTSTGNIGIGTSTPSSKLSVAGDLYVTGSFRDSTNSAGTSGYVLLSTGTGTSWVATSSLGIGGGGGSSLFTDGGATTYLTATGDNLAVGTTTATQRLAVSGNIDLVNTGGLYFNGTQWVRVDTSLGSTYIGEDASGMGNTNAFGVSAGQYASGGGNNYFGYAAGQNSFGDGSNFLGEYAGSENIGWENNFLGYTAGQYNDGSYNNFLGYEAGVNNVGSNNNAIGRNAGTDNSGSFNNFIGAFAGVNIQATSSDIIGAYAFEGFGTYQVVNNVALGYRAGATALTGADNNTLIGFEAGADNLYSGSNNIVLGYDIDLPASGGSNQLTIGNLIYGTGIDGTGTTVSTGNVGIGTSTPSSKLSVAGDLYVTGSFRDSTNSAGTSGYVLLSTGTGTSWVATSSLGISGGGSSTLAGLTDVTLTSPSSGEYLTYNGSAWINSAAPGGSSLFTDGGTTTYLTATGDNLAVGTSTQIGSARLSVNGDVGVPLGNGYQVGGETVLVKYDGAYFGPTNIWVGSTASSLNTAAAFYNTAVGQEALQSLTDGALNVAVGAGALQALTTGGDNVALGVAALQTATSSYSNTAVGRAALQNTTTGGGNTAVGANALISNTTGQENTAVGGGSLSGNTTGLYNVAIGVNTLSSNAGGFGNTGIGFSALQNNTGSENVGIGVFALGANTTGASNLALGGYALQSNTTGANNTALGASASASNTDGEENIAIGANALTANESGYYNIAIGRNAGADITGSASSGANTLLGHNTGRGITTGTNNTVIGANVTGLSATLSNNVIIADGAGNQRIRIDSSGNVGIKQTAPAVALHVGGTAIADGTQLLRLQDTNSSCNFTANSGTPSCGSDIRLKKDISLIEGELNTILALEPKFWRLKTDSSNDPSTLQSGFIAQDVETVLPELVTESDWIDGSRKKFLNIGGMMPYVVGAIKELWEEVMGNRERIEELERKVELLESQLGGDMASSQEGTTNTGEGKSSGGSSYNGTSTPETGDTASTTPDVISDEITGDDGENTDTEAAAGETSTDLQEDPDKTTEESNSDVSVAEESSSAEVSEPEPTSESGSTGENDSPADNPVPPTT